MPRVHPENSLAGFALAVSLGADGIELDVHATRDGIPVVHHDPVTPAAEGSAVAIADASLGELRARVGSSSALPTLEEVVELVDGAVQLYVEVKASAIEQAVVRVLGAHAAWCAVHSFDHRVVATVRALAPEIRCGVLMSSYLLDPMAPLRDTGAADLWQHWSMIDEPLVAAAHAIGRRVIAWTVNDPTASHRLLQWKVDGLCTDDIRALPRS